MSAMMITAAIATIATVEAATNIDVF